MQRLRRVPRAHPKERKRQSLPSLVLRLLSALHLPSVRLSMVRASLRPNVQFPMVRASLQLNVQFPMVRASLRPSVRLLMVHASLRLSVRLRGNATVERLFLGSVPPTLLARPRVLAHDRVVRHRAEIVKADRGILLLLVLAHGLAHMCNDRWNGAPPWSKRNQRVQSRFRPRLS